MLTIKRVVVTGASGFVGTRLCDDLEKESIDVRRVTRSLAGKTGATWFSYDTSVADNLELFRNVDAVVHLAARAHILKDKSSDPNADFERANVYDTINIAQTAMSAGVGRFLFISSIGVLGNATAENEKFSEASIERPVEPYAVSKLNAEHALKELVKDSPMELVIVRPPLVYGEGNPGNFLQLLKLVRSGFPLPFGAVRNTRSFVYVGNLSSALIQCIQHPAASGNTYLVSDSSDLSTVEMMSTLAHFMGVPPRIFSFPLPLLQLAACMVGKRQAISKLTASLSIDSSKIRHDLDWMPPFQQIEGLKRTVQWFMQERK